MVSPDTIWYRRIRYVAIVSIVDCLQNSIKSVCPPVYSVCRKKYMHLLWSSAVIPCRTRTIQTNHRYYISNPPTYRIFAETLNRTIERVCTAVVTNAFQPDAFQPDISLFVAGISSSKCRRRLVA
ncbi:unnamed protein product [Ectocarpus sp. 8 AP-2014]